MEVSPIPSRGSAKSPGEEELLGENFRKAAQALAIYDAIIRVDFWCACDLITLI